MLAVHPALDNGTVRKSLKLNSFYRFKISLSCAKDNEIKKPAAQAG
jgi:hypothetical protein